jgi:hypothetical protein
VEVVDGEQQRALVGEVGEGPVEAVEEREAGRLLARRRLRQEHRGRQRRRPGEEAGAALGVSATDGALEQLADDAEGEAGLELAAARLEHPAVVRARRLGGAGEEARLADPGGAFDRQRAARAAVGVGQSRTDPAQLFVALQQGRGIEIDIGQAWASRRSAYMSPWSIAAPAASGKRSNVRIEAAGALTPAHKS